MNRQTMGCVAVLGVLLLTGGCGESHTPPGVEVGKKYQFRHSNSTTSGQVTAVVGRWIQVHNTGYNPPLTVWINSDLVCQFQEY